MEEYIRGFCGVDGQLLSYGLRDVLEPPAAASDPTYCTNGSNYFTHNEEMIACGSILGSPAVSVSNPEAVGPFTYSFITDRALIWDNMVTIFQVSDSWTYLKPSNKHNGVRMGYKIIYNHYLGPSDINYMASGAEKKLTQCTYTREKINWIFEKYATLHKEQHNILESLKEH